MKRDGRSIIARWPVSSKITRARVGADQPLVRRRRRSTGTSMSLRPHTISVGTSISRQPVAERVAEQRLQAADEARRPGARDQLGGQRHRQPLRVAHDDLQRQPAQPRAGATTGSCLTPARARRRGQQPRRRPAPARARMFSADSPAAETSTSLRDPRRERQRQLGADEAAHRVADHDRATRSRAASQQRVDDARVALDRDPPRAASPTRRSRAGRARCTRCVSMNAGMLSSQFCHSPPSPCRNSSGGLVAAGVDHVDRAGPSTSRVARQRRPVDRHPGRVVAVGVRRGRRPARTQRVARRARAPAR